MKVEPLTEPLQTTDENTAVPPTPQDVSAPFGGTGPISLGSWGSPAFSQRSRSSFGALVDTPFDPFAEEDGFVPGKGRKRPRFSMRSNEWRLIDDPESPHEKERPVDWMELESEVSEQEAYDKDLAEDVKETESLTAGLTVPDTRESPGFAELHDEVIPVQPLSKPCETGYGRDLEQLAKYATQSAGFDAIRNLEDRDSKASANGAFDHFIHLPTDTPRLHPVPSPGLPIPSPLVPSNNLNGYFASFAHTPQASHGRSFTKETTQITTTEGEGDIGSQMQQMPSQPQTTAPDTGMETKKAPPPENVPVVRAFGIDIQETWPTSVDEATDPLRPVNIQPKEVFERVPGYDEGGEQAESAALAAAQKQQAAIEDVPEYSQMQALVSEREESDVDQEYGEEDEYDLPEAEHLPQEGELSDKEGGLGEDLVEQGQELLHQQLDSKDPHERRQVDVIDLDSDENEDEEMEMERNDHDAAIGDADAFSSVRNDVNGRAHYPDYEEEDEESGDDIEEELAEDEDVENDYMSENEYPEGYEDEVYYELESEGASGEEEYGRPSPPKGEPEVIILDSDSDEEPQPIVHRQLVERPKEVFGPQEPEPAGLASDMYSGSETAAVKEELVSVYGEQLEEVTVEDENMEDVSVEDDDVRGAWNQSAQVHPFSSTSAAVSQKELTRDGEDGQINMPIWLDGAASPAPVSDIKAPVLVQEQPMTPEDSQEDHQTIRDATLDDILPTPRDSHDAAVESTLQHQIGGPTTPSKDAPSTESGFKPLSTGAQGRVEIKEPSIPEDVKEHDYPEEDESPAASERYFSPPAGLDNDTPGLHSKRTRFASPGSLGKQEHPSEDWPAHGEIGRDTSVAVSERYFSPPTGPDPPHTPDPRSRPAHMAPLATLVDYSDALTDTISIVCHVSTSRATLEESGHILTIQITDPSMSGSSVPVQILRPGKETMPSMAEGDAILLRNFQVKIFDHSLILSSVDASSWNVFCDSGDSAQDTGRAEGRTYATEIRQWYREFGASMVADSQLQASIGGEGMDGTPDSNGAISDEESVHSGLPAALDDSQSLPKSARRRRRFHRKITVHELRDGRRYTQVGSPSGKEDIHELRDGTVYVNL